MIANKEHVKLLGQGIAVWNNWRKEQPYALPVLSGTNFGGATLSQANLSGAVLSGANLSGTNLSGANLTRANLSGADLTKANLIGVKLSGADLTRANLAGANLSRANLTGANLIGANLSRAYFIGANLSYANLAGTNLSGTNLHTTYLGYTIFAWVDLGTVVGLETVAHKGPSSVDVKTVKLPQGDARAHFLRGVGFPDSFIDYLPSLFTAAIQYVSCSISYANADEVLARRLCKDLQDQGIRCWLAPHGLRPGDAQHSAVDGAIFVHEKVLLLLSEHSVNSTWVKHEVQTALANETTYNSSILFPLRLDQSVMQLKEDWAVDLRVSRHIGDISLWKDEIIYQQRFMEILHYLKSASV